MSTNKKLLRQKKYLRRLAELKKASAKAGTAFVSDSGPTKLQPGAGEIVSTFSGPSKYELPITVIKRDLWKNLAFALFSVALVVSLKITGFGFEQVKYLLNL